MPLPAAAPPLPVPAPLVSLGSPSRDNVAHLAKLVASAAALRRRYPALELVIVDNDSRSPTTSAFLDWSAADWLRVVQDRGGFNFSRRSEEHTSELQSLMRISYAVFCLTKKN